MAQDNEIEITDDYSDYNIARRVLGVGGVLGFGLFAGRAVMNVNNSAFIRSLSSQLGRPDFNANTGSILGSGASLTKSKLIRDSIERTMTMGSVREEVLKDELAALYISKKDGFLDRVIQENAEFEEEHRKRQPQKLDVPTTRTADARKFYKPSQTTDYSRMVADMFNFVEDDINISDLSNTNQIIETIQTSSVLHFRDTVRDLTRVINRLGGTEQTPRLQMADLISTVTPKSLTKLHSGLLETSKGIDQFQSTTIREALQSEIHKIRNGTVNPEEIERFVKRAARSRSLPDTIRKQILEAISVISDSSISTDQKRTSKAFQDIAILRKQRIADKGLASLRQKNEIIGGVLKDISQELAAGRSTPGTFVPSSRIEVFAAANNTLKEILEQSMGLADEFSGVSPLLDDFSTRLTLYANTQPSLNRNQVTYLNALSDSAATYARDSGSRDRLLDDLRNLNVVLGTENVDISRQAGFIIESIESIEKRGDDLLSSFAKQATQRGALHPTFLQKLLSEIKHVNQPNLSQKLAFISDMTNQFFAQQVMEQASLGQDVLSGLDIQKETSSYQYVRRQAQRKLRKYTSRMFGLSRRHLRGRNVLDPTDVAAIMNRRNHSALLDLQDSKIKLAEIPSIETETGAKGSVMIRNQLTQAVSNLEQIGKAKGRRSFVELANLYKNAELYNKTNKAILGTKFVPHMAGMMTGLGINPHSQFVESSTTHMNDISNALKERTGAEKVIVATRVITDGQEVEWKFIPVVGGQRQAAVEFTLPVMVGNVMMKGNNAIVMPAIFTQAGTKGVYTNPITHILDYVQRQIAKPKNAGFLMALDTVELNDHIKNITHSITGKGGLFGVGQLINNKSFFESLRFSNALDLRMHKETSNIITKHIDYQIRRLTDEIQRRSNSGYTDNKQLEVLREQKRQLELRKENQGTGFEKGVTRTENLNKMQSYDINGFGFSAKQAYAWYETNFGPSILSEGADSAVAGRHTLNKGPLEVGMMNIAGGSKVFFNAGDVFEQQMGLFESNTSGYTLGNGLSFGERNNLHFFLENEIGSRLKLSPIYQRFLSKLQKHKMERSRLQPGIKPYYEHDKQLSERISDLTNQITERERVPNSGKSISDNLILSELRKDLSIVEFKQSRLRKHYKKQLKVLNSHTRHIRKIHNITKYITSDKLRKNYSSVPISEDEALDYNKARQYAKKTYGYDIEDVVIPPKPVHSQHSTLITRNKFEYMKTFGFVEYGEQGKILKVDPSGLGTVPLKALVTDAALVGEGATIMTNAAIQKMGAQVTSHNKKKIEIGKFQKLFKSLVARGDKETYTEAMTALQALADKGGEFSVDDMHNVLDNKQITSLLRAFNTALNDKRGKYGLMKNDGKQELIKDGRGMALFSGIAINTDGTVDLKYNFVHQVIEKTKIIDELNNKYVLQQIVSDEQMEAITRHEFLSKLKQGKSGHTLGDATVRFLENYDLNTYKGTSQTEWQSFMGSLQGVNNSALRRVASTMKAHEIIYSGKKMTQQQGHIAIGIIQDITNDLFNHKAIKKHVQNPKAKNVIDDVFSLVLDSLTREPTDEKLERMNIKRLTNKSQAQLVPDRRGNTQDIHTMFQSKEQLDTLALRLFNVTDNADFKARAYPTLINNVNTRLADAVQQGVMSEGEARTIRRAIQVKIGTTLVKYDQNAMPLNMITGILDVFRTTQSEFDLNTVSRRRYDNNKGFFKGAKISLFDAMMMKIQGQTQFHAKVIEHMKHGNQYFQAYAGTFLSLAGRNPAEVFEKINPHQSDKTRTAITTADIVKEVLHIKTSEMETDPITGIKTLKAKDSTIANLLDFQGDISSKFLHKIRLTKEEIDALDLGPAAKRLGIVVDDAARDLSKQLYYEIDLNEIRNLSEDKQIKVLRLASARVNLEEVSDYQKLLRKYKSLSFTSVDQPKQPAVEVSLSNLKYRRVSTLELQRFSDDRDVQTIVDTSKMKVSAHHDINNVLEHEVVTPLGDGKTIKNRHVSVLLNTVHQASLALVRATSVGASERVISHLSNSYADEVIQHTRSLYHNQQNKGLPGTVRGIAMAKAGIRLDRMNAWSILDNVVKGFDSKLNTGLSGVNIFDLAEDQAVAHLRKIVNSEHGAEVTGSIQSYLDAPAGYSPEVGSTYMSKSRFQEALSNLRTPEKTKEIANKVMASQGAFMSEGVRYPTIRPENIMPYANRFFDHEILGKIYGDENPLMKSFGSGRGASQDAIFVNAIDMGLAGGDYDRDMYSAIMGLSDMDDALQKQHQDNLIKHLSFQYEYKTIDGKQSIVVKGKSAMGVRASKIWKDISKVIGDKGLTVDSKTGDIAVFGEREKDMIENMLSADQYIDYLKSRKTPDWNQNIKRQEGIAHSKVLFQVSKDADKPSDLQRLILDSTRPEMGILSMTKDEIEQEASRRNLSVNALLTREANKANAVLDSYARTMLNLGYTPDEVNHQIGLAKYSYAAGESIDSLLDGKFKRKAEQAVGPMLALKSLTGPLHNVVKHIIVNSAMSVTEDVKTIGGIHTWSGNVQQVNISSKHKIPVIVEDFISTVKTSLSPHSDDFDRTIALDKIRKGKFKAEISKSELHELFDTIKTVRTHKDQITSKNGREAISTLEDVFASITDSKEHYIEKKGISNHQWLSYLKSKYAIGMDHNEYINQRLGLTTDELSDIQKGIEGTEKGIRQLSEGSHHFLGVVPQIQKHMRIMGIDSIDQMGAYTSIAARRGRSTYRVAQDMLTILDANTNSPLELETARIAGVAIREKITADTPSVFLGESSSAATSRHLTSRIRNFARNSKLSRYIDTDSMANSKMGVLAGMAAIGFIGAFALQSNARTWLGPTAGTGGEYAEHKGRKDEENLANMSTTQRLGEAGVRSPYLHMRPPKDARYIQNSINQGYGATRADRLRRLANPELVDSPMEFKL